MCMYVCLSVCLPACLPACMHACMYVFKMSLYLCIYVCNVPVVPDKAVAEVSKIGTYRRGWLLWITDGKANPLMDRKVLEVSSLSLSFSGYLPTYLPTYVSIYLSICLSACLSVWLSNCKLENAALLRDFLNVWTWQRQKWILSEVWLQNFLRLHDNACMHAWMDGWICVCVRVVENKKRVWNHQFLLVMSSQFLMACTEDARGVGVGA